MPELPEVETVRRSLEKRAMGLRVQHYLALRPGYLRTGAPQAERIAGGVIESVCRKGKLLAIHLSNQWVLLHHLGMSGRLLFSSAHDPVPPHTHVRIQLEQEWEIRQRDPRRFGYAAILPLEGLDQFPSWKNMGVDPFIITPKKFAELVQARSKPIKNFLLDQQLVAGLGNIYVDESLFRAKIHPLTLSRGLTENDAARLLRCIRRVLQESIAAGGSSTNDFQQLDGTLGEFQHKHRVYRRTGMRCLECGERINRVTLGGRGTHFCPGCQKLETGQ